MSVCPYVLLSVKVHWCIYHFPFSSVRCSSEEFSHPKKQNAIISNYSQLLYYFHPSLKIYLLFFWAHCCGSSESRIVDELVRKLINQN